MKKKFPTIAIGAFLALQISQAEDEPRRVREDNADREVRRENSRPGERERDRAPEERRVRSDREGDRRADRGNSPVVRFRGEGDRPPPPPLIRREGVREAGVRPPPREGERGRPPFVRRVGENDRPPHGRPSFPWETDGRQHPQRVHPQQAREGGPPSPERLRQEQPRGDQMVGALREELRRSQQLNAELRNRMQLLEQRLKRLETR